MTQRRRGSGNTEVFRLRSLVLVALLSLVAIPVVLFAAVMDASSGSPALGDILVAALGSLFADAFMWFLFLRPRLVISDDGVTVVNYGGPNFLPWDEVTAFDAQLRLQVRTRRRGRVEVQAIPATGIQRLFGRPSGTDRLARRLNEDHRELLASAGEAIPKLTIDSEDGQREIRTQMITVAVLVFTLGVCWLAWTFA